MTSTPSQTPQQQSDLPVVERGNLAQAPIRWPRFTRESLGLTAVWALGGVIALFVPALFVSPTAVTAAVGQLAWAFGSTVVGALVMVAAAFVLYRRSGNLGFLVMGAVPAVASVIGGIVLAATKLGGSGVAGS